MVTMLQKKSNQSSSGFQRVVSSSLGRKILYAVTLVSLALLSVLIGAYSSAPEPLVPDNAFQSNDEVDVVTPPPPPPLASSTDSATTVTADTPALRSNNNNNNDDSSAVTTKDTPKLATADSAAAAEEELPCLPSEAQNTNLCWLSPAWGTQEPVLAKPTNASVCVGNQPALPTTTATHLTCEYQGQFYKRCFDKHPGFTIGLLYYANPSMLRLQLQTMAQYPEEIRKQVTLLIVDDGSPTDLGAAEYITDQDRASFRIRIARINDNLMWNIGGARNLLGHVVDTDQMLLLDVDITVPTAVVTNMITWPTRSDTGDAIAHKFNRIRADGKTKKMHPAMTFLDIKAYWANGGCDEDFVGSYGYTDPHFWHRFKLNPKNILSYQKNDYLQEHDKDRCDAELLGNFDAQVIAKCVAASEKLPPVSRNRQRNVAIFSQKKKTGCWSNQFLRFTYSLIE